MNGAVFTLAAWAALSVPIGLAVGRALRRADPYPLFDPTPVRIVYGGRTMVHPYPLGQAELQRIVGLFDPAALVGPVSADGHATVTFPDDGMVWRFVSVVRDGVDGVTPIVDSVEVVSRVLVGDEAGPVTLSVTVSPAWRHAVAPEVAA